MRNQQHQQRNKLRCDKMQKASLRCRETQENTHINTQYKHKKVANNVPNEIKQKRVVMSENNGEMPMDNKKDCAHSKVDVTQW